MKRIEVDSKTFRSLGYDGKAHLLEAEFTSGEIYHYFSVPRRTWNDLMAADSKGRFFALYIRDHFPFAKQATGI